WRGRIDQRTKRPVPSASMKRNALTLLYCVLVQLSDHGAVFAHLPNSRACGWAARNASIAAGSGLPVAGSGRLATVCSWNACGVATAKNGKLFNAMRHCGSPGPPNCNAMLRTRALLSAPCGLGPPIENLPSTACGVPENTRALDSARPSELPWNVPMTQTPL